MWSNRDFCANPSPSVCFTRCGDGMVVGREQCDAAGHNGGVGSGCLADCTVEPGWRCSPPATPGPGQGGSQCEPVCGDGFIAGGEQCDDGPGNGAAGGRCGSSCRVVPGPAGPGGPAGDDEAVGWYFFQVPPPLSDRFTRSEATFFRSLARRSLLFTWSFLSDSEKHLLLPKTLVPRVLQPLRCTCSTCLSGVVTPKSKP